MPVSDQEHAQPLVLGHRTIGPGCPPYVIAEAGVNHDGDVGKALALVDVAVAAGADAVKFQVFTAEDLTVAKAPLAAYQHGPATSQRDLLRRLALSDDAFARLRSYCDERRIDFLATPFTIGDATRLAALDPPAVKVASTDLNNWPLLRRLVAFQRPLLVSTGAATLDEIAGTVAWLQEWQAFDRTVLLHCVSSYPTPLPAANLAAIARLHDHFTMLVGYSDHTRSVETGGWAAMLGARVIEKHFTLDTSAPGPDHAMSLNPSGLAVYVAAIRAAHIAAGNGHLGFQPLEDDVRRVSRKSIVAARELTAGTRLTDADLAVKRPAGGIAPADWPRVIGRTLKRRLSADAPLQWDLLS